MSKEEKKKQETKKRKRKGGKRKRRIAQNASCGPFNKPTSNTINCHSLNTQTNVIQEMSLNQSIYENNLISSDIIHHCRKRILHDIDHSAS